LNEGAACGECEEKCTQKLKIIEEMKYLVDKFGKKD
jgi:predicted aldo/keto reductase-like oxidoreductase